MFAHEVGLINVIGYYYKCVYSMLYYGYLLSFIYNYDELLDK